jgi:hypothetical protein
VAFLDRQVEAVVASRVDLGVVDPVGQEDAADLGLVSRL